jgi:hypothetical protein
MKNTLHPALARVLLISISGFAIATGTARAEGGGPASDPRAVGKTRAQVRAELKVNRPTASQHDRDIAQSVTGLTPVNRTKTAP